MGIVSFFLLSSPFPIRWLGGNKHHSEIRETCAMSRECGITFCFSPAILRAIVAMSALMRECVLCAEAKSSSKSEISFRLCWIQQQHTHAHTRGYFLPKYLPCSFDTKNHQIRLHVHRTGTVHIHQRSTYSSLDCVRFLLLLLLYISSSFSSSSFCFFAVF